MHHLKELMHVHTAREPNGNYSLMLTVITPKFESTSNCLVPKNTSCELAHSKKHNPIVI